jgi:uncharacterized protein (TIGR02453 family)
MSDIPPFAGFSPEGLRFLQELADNNDKAWFDAHKAIYQQELLLPAQALVAALGQRLQEISPKITYDTRTNGAGSLMRIYRDTRFSQDKSPYKTNIAMVFWEGPRKKMENPSFGFQFGTWGAGLYAGQFTFPRDMLPAYRDAVADDKTGATLEDAIAQVQAAGAYEIQGEQYKRVPTGYPADHPRAELLKYKGLRVMSPQLDPQVLTSPELVDVLFAHCRHMAPIQQWLVAVDRSATAA